MNRYFRMAGFLAMVLLAACSPERKLAEQYVNQHTGNGIMIVPSNELLKDNLSISYDTTIKYTPLQLDSIAWAQSFFLPYISDSVFLTLFTNEMIDELTHEGFDVYVDASSDVFLSLPDPKWVVQVGQLQLNEDHKFNYFETYSDENGEPEVHRVRINQVRLESWFNVNRVNADTKKVIYLEGYIEDEIRRGYNIRFSEGTIGTDQNRDSIQLNDVYLMAKQLGRKHAELLFDYFMNEYITENLPEGTVKRKYFYFDRTSNSLKQGQREHFEEVK